MRGGRLQALGPRIDGGAGGAAGPVPGSREAAMGPPGQQFALRPPNVALDTGMESSSAQSLCWGNATPGSAREAWLGCPKKCPGGRGGAKEALQAEGPSPIGG